MRIVARPILRNFWDQPQYRDAEQPLKAWFEEVENATWASPNEIKAQFGNASILKGKRVVFNIKGNDYRLIVSFSFKLQIAYVKFIGTHAQYDKVDAETVEMA